MKWFRWLGSLLIISLVAAGVSAASTYYVLTVYVQEMLKPYAAVLPTQPIHFSEFMAKLWPGSNIVGRGGTTQAGEEQPQPDPASPVTEPREEEDAVAVWSQTGNSATLDKDKVVMSAEQFLSKREKLSEEDKTSIFSMLASRLPEEALQQISTFLEDGLTAAELEQVEKIVEQYLPPEEFSKLMEIVNKY